jgi:hypothetical protein
MIEVDYPSKTSKGDSQILHFKIPAGTGTKVSDFCDEKSTPANIHLSLRCILRSLDGLHTSIDARMKVLRMRVLCLFIALHSRIPQDKLDHILKKEAQVVRDLVALSDKLSEPVVGLMHPLFSDISIIALEIVLFLIDANGFRRNEANFLHRPSDVIDELGLSPNRVNESSQCASWLSILQSSCAIATHLTPHHVARVVDGDLEYLHTGLRLFSTVTMLQLHLFPSRESSHIDEASSIAPINAVLQTAAPMIAYALATNGTTDLPKMLLEESMWAYSRVLSTLDLCANFTAFRECEVLNTVVDLLTIFADVDIQMLSEGMKLVLEKALGVLGSSISCSRRGIVNPMDSGVNCLYQVYFSKICSQIFESKFRENKSLWFCAVEVITGAIFAEPAYLSNFLSSDYCRILQPLLRVDVSVKSTAEDVEHSLYRCSDGYIMFLPLLKLVLASAITVEGTNFAVESRIPQQIVSSVMFSCYLLPQSTGIPVEVLKRCGKYLSQIIREIPSFKRFVHEGVRNSLLYACYEANRAKEAFTPESETEYDSVRMKALQRVANICTLIEHMGTSEGRRSSTEFLRDVLKEDVVDALFKAYSCSLPLPRQLLAQMSLVQDTPLINFGYSTAARAMNSLIKLGVGYSYHVILSTTFKNIENVLNTVSNQKRILRGLVNDTTSLHGEELDGNTELLSMRKRRGRGSSNGQQSSASVLILGVLDSFPDSHCTYDDLQRVMEETSPELSLNTWKFLISLLELEWYSSMLANCLRVPPRQAGPSLIPAYKDSIRRIYAFYRSSMLEVCRLNATTWAPKVCKNFHCN